jgi:hypothetical protein
MRCEEQSTSRKQQKSRSEYRRRSTQRSHLLDRQRKTGHTWRQIPSPHNVNADAAIKATGNTANQRRAFLITTGFVSLQRGYLDSVDCKFRAVFLSLRRWKVRGSPQRVCDRTGVSAQAGTRTNQTPTKFGPLLIAWKLSILPTRESSRRRGQGEGQVCRNCKCSGSDLRDR